MKLYCNVNDEGTYDLMLEGDDHMGTVQYLDEHNPFVFPDGREVHFEPMDDGDLRISLVDMPEGFHEPLELVAEQGWEADQGEEITEGPLASFRDQGVTFQEGRETVPSFCCEDPHCEHCAGDYRADGVEAPTIDNPCVDSVLFKENIKVMTEARKNALNLKESDISHD